MTVTGIRLSPAGDAIHLAVLGADGEPVAAVTLTPAQAAAVGGQLVSHAGVPLTTDYTLTLHAPDSTQPDVGYHEQGDDPHPAGAGGVTPAQLAALRQRFSRDTAPTPAPVYTVASPEPVATTPAEWVIPRSALLKATGDGISEQQLREIASNPDRIHPAPDGRANVHEATGIGVIIRGQAIIGHYRYTTPAPRTPQAEPPRTGRGKSGGPGRRVPSGYSDLLRTLRAHGFTVDENRGGGHPLITHPATPGFQYSMPRTPSDHRSFANMVAQLRHHTGIDITR